MPQRRPRPQRGRAIGRSARPHSRPASRRRTGASRDSGELPRVSDAVAPPRSRLTGRAAILILLIAVLMVSYASSTRAYLQQRAHISDLKAEIADRSANIEAAEREKKRWQDDEFIEKKARERFGFLFPGETSYQVIDETGKPMDGDGSLSDPDSVAPVTPRAWWSSAWHSVELAGNPPKRSAPPAVLRSKQ
jgi:cell division protein FtsB